MSSLNVYVSSDLKARMQACPGLNWSKLATHAIETALELCAAGLDPAAVAIRLQRTVGASSSAFKQGYNEGKAWAASTAEAGDLRVMAGLDLDLLLSQSKTAFAAANTLGKALGTDEDATFFFGAEGRADLSPSPITPDRLRGFVGGASDVAMLG